MNKFYYDLHVHSALSPCADNDNTPNNISGMASLCGIDIMALTDHNTSKNCPAFFKAAERYNIVPIAGMELTTAEDIHVVCLFEFLEHALKFDEFVEKKLIPVENRPDIFGDQLILNENDEIVNTFNYLLSNATEISVDEVKNLVEDFNGIAYPAHIDRQSNGIIAVLGTLPEYLNFNTVEINRKEVLEKYVKEYSLQNKTVIVSSDAHYLTDFKDKENFFELNAEKSDGALVRKELFKILRGN